jgi:hypothetical protein
VTAIATRFRDGYRDVHGVSVERGVDREVVELMTERSVVEQSAAEMRITLIDGSIHIVGSDLELSIRVHAPTVEEPAAAEATGEEPAAEEPVAEEPVAEEPVAEEPVAEEPVAEEPVAEEPAAEEPAAEEPAAGVAGV